MKSQENVIHFSNHYVRTKENRATIWNRIKEDRKGEKLGFITVTKVEGYSGSHSEYDREINVNYNQITYIEDTEYKE